MIDNQTTLVTALYDIGRKNFVAYSRTIDTYLKYLDNVLSLQSNIVIYCEQSLEAQIKNIRKTYDPTLKHTKIKICPFENLECYQMFYERTKTTMETEFFKQNNEGSIESLYPKYNIINFNKISFVCDAINNNYFNSKYYFWIDAGFHHDSFPTHYRKCFYPNLKKVLMLEDERVHFLSLCPEAFIPLESMFSSRVSITGSMFAGKPKPLMAFKQLVFDTIDSFLNNGAVNDDQTIYAFCYTKNKKLFSISCGNWFDNFSLFV